MTNVKLKKRSQIKLKCSTIFISDYFLDIEEKNVFREVSLKSIEVLNLF